MASVIIFFHRNCSEPSSPGSPEGPQPLWFRARRPHIEGGVCRAVSSSRGRRERILIVFSGGMYVGKNTLHGAQCASVAVARSEVNPPNYSEPAGF